MSIGKYKSLMEIIRRDLHEVAQPFKKTKSKPPSLLPCQHGIIKSHCRHCTNWKEFKLCPHDKVRRDCQICSPSRFCIHNKRKSNCLDCNGKRKRKLHPKCIHDKREDKCLDCNGRKQTRTRNPKSAERFEKYKCVHEKMRYDCIICSPHIYCFHSRKKAGCNVCNALCQHNIQRKLCLTCSVPLTPEEKKVMLAEKPLVESLQLNDELASLNVLADCVLKEIKENTPKPKPKSLPFGKKMKPMPWLNLNT
jgi:hypothetical protein